ncbi:MAG: succinate dehydrogenase, hydrophobic membrane anchor protein [Alphaproteobacteria bacterium]|nr:succinate dehydrogenase, hydrophobic membrane anchor protein [Alphaproteobacteria bacterium]TAD87467.1 MAG: succinate dehydrogenase, hydrophobic membrane anchor protein [Alphaproteobacteria bacterium]
MSRPLRSSLGRVRGLGSAKEGVSHWWVQRMTALALIPLALWFVAGIISVAGADYAAMRAWVGHPVTATLLVALMVAVFWHAKLGLQVVLEDYLHHEGQRMVAIVVMQGLMILLGIASVVSVLKLAFGG